MITNESTSSAACRRFCSKLLPHTGGALFHFFVILALLDSCVGWGSETSQRLELRQGATPETLLVRSGFHDFKEPLRIPVESAGPTVEVALRHKNQIISQYRSTIETKEVNAVKTFTLVISIDFLHKEDIQYVVRHTIANPAAPLFIESYKAELDSQRTPLLVREFAITNRTGIDWGMLKEPFRLVLIDSRRGILFDDADALAVPKESSLRLRQELDCRVESDAVLIDPVAVKTGDARQSLRLSNGSIGSADKVRAELPSATKLEIVRSIIDPKRPLETATFPRDIPLGPPDSVVLPCNCGTDVQSTANRVDLDIGRYSDVHVLEVANGPKLVWLPVSASPTEIVYFTGVSRKVVVHNRSNKSVRLGISNVISGDSISFSKVTAVPLDIHSGQTIDMSDSNGFDLKLINVQTEQVSRTDNVAKYVETSNTLVANLTSYINSGDLEKVMQFYCTHPATRQKTRCLSTAQFRVFLETLMADLKKNAEAVASLQGLQNDLKLAKASKQSLTTTLREFTGPNAEQYAKERIRIESRIADIDQTIRKLEAKLVPVQAELVWNANPDRFGFDGKPWEREPKSLYSIPLDIIKNGSLPMPTESQSQKSVEVVQPIPFTPTRIPL